MVLLPGEFVYELPVDILNRHLYLTKVKFRVVAVKNHQFNPKI